MQRIMNMVRHFPFLSGVTLASLAIVAAWSATNTYAVWMQPDPYVVSLPLGTQKEAAPIANTGVDAHGFTLDQWIAGGRPAAQFAPIPKTTYKPGESMWILRYDCFVNKVSDGVVSRAFLGGDSSQGAPNDPRFASRSIMALPDIQIPTRTDGCAVKNHRVPIPADLLAGTWTYQATVNFYKNTQQPSVRVHFKPVVITVTK